MSAPQRGRIRWGLILTVATWLWFAWNYPYWMLAAHFAPVPLLMIGWALDRRYWRTEAVRLYVPTAWTRRHHDDKEDA